MKRLFLVILFAGLTRNAMSENYLINGGQLSRISYRLTQHIEPVQGTQSLKLSFVVPETYSSPTYNQQVSDFQLVMTPEPDSRKEEKDKRGNQIVTAVWNKPSRPVDVAMRFAAANETRLERLESGASFPLTGIPPEIKDYLTFTEQVQGQDPGIQAKAKELVSGVKTEFDAVQRILTWLIDNMRYVSPPMQYDAIYSFENGKGNCQNYSHLSAALMRCVGIPVRIVNGVTLKQPFTVRSSEGEFTFKMGQGRHSWIEVYFPDLGWVPFDPQQTELFVSNRFIRCEVGIDNNEAVNDGMVRWSLSKGVKGRPEFQEVIEADFVQDQVQLSLEKQNYGPKNMLICPDMAASFVPVIVPKSPPPKEVPPDQLSQLVLNKPYLFGNLDFPRGLSFIQTRGPAEEGKEDFSMRKNFLVETAEYVTTKMIQYAQIVVLKQPLKLQKAGLALFKFGGSGQIWIDLMKDEGGRPGQVIAASDLLNLDQLISKTGYDWVDFDFGKNPPVLSPGKYWIGLGFTGSPIVNWYYTYGKPVGPVDGTRYKGVYDEQWSGALAYEFNYRVVGWSDR